MPCDATAAEILAGIVPWTYEMLQYGGEAHIKRLGPLEGGDTDYGEGYGVIFGDEATAKAICEAMNAHMVAS